MVIPEPVDVSIFYMAFAEEVEQDGSSSSNEYDDDGSTNIPLRRFPHLQLQFVTSQQQFIDHMHPFRSRVVIPNPLQVVSVRDMGVQPSVLKL